MKISIIGAAGTMGSCAAFYIGINKLADEIIMIDPWEGMLKTYWMDLNIALNRLDIFIQQGDYQDMVGSDIVVIASAALAKIVNSPADLLIGNFAILKENAENITKYCPNAIVITDTNPVDGLNYAMYLMSESKDRRKYIGYSLNDTYRFCQWVAQSMGVNVGQVRGIVMGEHGGSQVMLFSSLTLEGKPIKLHETIKKTLREMPAKNFQEMENLNPKRTYGFTSSVGTVEIIKAIKNNTREVIPCNALLQGEYGYSNTTCGVPAVIGKNGVEEIQILKLTDDEEAALKYSIQVISPQMRWVEKQLGIER